MFFPSPLPPFVFYPLILDDNERVFSGRRSKTFFTALEKVLEGVVKKTGFGRENQKTSYRCPCIERFFLPLQQITKFTKPNYYHKIYEQKNYLSHDWPMLAPVAVGWSTEH